MRALRQSTAEVSFASCFDLKFWMTSQFDAMCEYEISKNVVDVHRRHQARVEWEMRDVQAKYNKAASDYDKFMALQPRDREEMCGQFEDAVWEDILSAISSEAPVYLKYDLARNYIKDHSMRRAREFTTDIVECVPRNLKLLDKVLAGYRMAKYSDQLSQLSGECNKVLRKLDRALEACERTIFHRLATTSAC